MSELYPPPKHSPLLIASTERRNANFENYSGATVSTLRLHDVTEITGEPWLPLYFESLKRLELDMSVFLAFGTSPRFLPWMSALPNIEAFKLVQRSSGKRDLDVMAALYPQALPRLQWLHLENLVTDWTALMGFLLGHHQTLTHLKVLNPVCAPSVWSQMRTQLEDGSVFERLQGGICDLSVPSVVAPTVTESG